MYKFGIIGCGRIAKRHAEQASVVGKLQAVCDVVQHKADELALLFHAKSYSSIDDLLINEPEVDIICICSPNGLHAEHAIKSLQAGRHVLCEKPLSISSIAARQMMETAYFFKKKLFVVKQNRYNPPIQEIKRLIDAGSLGKILSFQINCFWNRPQEYYTGDWKGTKLLDGGILYTQFSHFIDILIWFLGDLKEVSGFKANSLGRNFMEIEDNGVAILKMESGAIGTLNYTVNAVHRNMEGSFSIFGEKACVKIGGQYLNTIEWFASLDPSNLSLQQDVPANNYGFYQGSMSNHDKVYADIIESMKGSSTGMVEAAEALKTIEIIEKIYASSDGLQ